MKVYILESQIDYEGSSTYGVFSTAEKAMKYFEKNYRKDGEWVKEADGYRLIGKRDMICETIYITEVEVQ